MKFFCLFLFCIASIASFAQQKIAVFILAGQSNATGQGYMANLNAGQKVEDSVLIYHSGKPHLEGKGPANQWHPLAQASESPDRFGPELGLAHRLQQLIGKSQKIAFIKHAHSGTDLARQWNAGTKGDTASHGEQYQVFLQTVLPALADLKRQGYQPDIKAMFWQQGENDANNIADAEAYEQNLKHFILRVRDDLNARDMPFVLGLVMPPPLSGAGRDLVRKAQIQAGTWPNVGLVQTDDLSRRADDKNSPHPTDHLHFGTAGTWDLGVRMANTWFYLNCK
ncbi:hypothetical protein BCY91_11280 [Pelobium manganitolerans]|uniref:Sialate O-acetylesterase domain-containing protein n=1 Tax=Pelobium manganitolerans TaxID=1842495 RepID=A0A419S258_9SPHI|nr:sialate O-acetylesterase [Pelobium manganitolerans]RKD12821.1 hypothetical protein BCY91_11280 [Pelobium manganitolerans]